MTAHVVGWTTIGAARHPGLGLDQFELVLFIALLPLDQPPVTSGCPVMARMSGVNTRPIQSRAAMASNARLHNYIMMGSSKSVSPTYPICHEDTPKPVEAR